MNKNLIYKVVGMLLVLATFAWAQPGREFSGTLRYMADAAVFESCDGVSWPVAMQAGYLELERRYLQAATGGEAIFVRVRGRLVVLPNMEDRPEEFVEVSEVLELDPSRGLDGCRGSALIPVLHHPVLHQGRWQLSGLAGFALTNVERVPYLMFRREGNAWRVSGYAGCNQMRAPYLTQGQQMLFGDIATTKRACFGEQGRLEAAFMRVLADANGYSLEGQTLSLLAGNEQLAWFTFSPETSLQAP